MPCSIFLNSLPVASPRAHFSCAVRFSGFTVTFFFFLAPRFPILVFPAAIVLVISANAMSSLFLHVTPATISCSWLLLSSTPLLPAAGACFLVRFGSTHLSSHARSAMSLGASLSEQLFVLQDPRPFCPASAFPEAAFLSLLWLHPFIVAWLRFVTHFQGRLYLLFTPTLSIVWDLTLWALLQFSNAPLLPRISFFLPIIFWHVLVPPSAIFLYWAGPAIVFYS